MATARLCPLCGKRPVFTRLDGKPLRWKATDVCGKHSSIGYTRIHAMVLYHSAIEYTRRDMLSANVAVPIVSLSWWDKLIKWLTG